MISFGTSQWLWGLLALPILAVLFGYAERKSATKLREFIAPRLLPQLTGSINRGRRVFRFGLQLLGLAFVFVSLAQPRWGYTFEDVKRKGIDLLIAVDTSRSMLSNDVQPNRLERVKLAAQDLISQLQGDRVGLIAFAGRAFLQAPLTIDYDAVVESIHDLDTKIIPEGGTNISEAIILAANTYGKSAVGNRALVIFTDGEELSGNAVKTAKAAAGAGIKIFTVGVGTPQGSLIPIAGEDGGTAFVKDRNGQVVKSKLDEKRLREVAEETGGIYLPLQSGLRTMRSLFEDGLSKLSPKEMDVRLSRRPIERYEWPLAAAVMALSASVLLRERKRVSVPRFGRTPMKLATATVLILLIVRASAAVPGLDLYQDGKYNEAYRAFQDDLKNNPDSPVRDKMQFDAGAAAYKMRDYDKAAEAFSQALLTKDKKLQGNSHYNMGRTLEERADMAKSDEEAITDLEDALRHYQDTLKLDPNNPGAKANTEEVKKKIERLKKKRKEKPTPPPQQPPKKQDKKDDQSGGGGGGSQNKQQQSSGQDKNQQQNQQQSQSQSQNQSGKGDNQQPQSGPDKSQAKNNSQQNPQDQQSQAGQSPSPSPQQNQASGAPSPSPGEGKEDERDKAGSGQKDQPPQSSPSPGEGENNASPSPSPGEGEGSDQGGSPSPEPSASPQKKFGGDIKGAGQDKAENQKQPVELAQAEPEKEGEMSERQARALLDSMKDEEARVQLNERRAARRVYNDW